MHRCQVSLVFKLMSSDKLAVTPTLPSTYKQPFGWLTSCNQIIQKKIGYLEMFDLYF